MVDFVEYPNKHAFRLVLGVQHTLQSTFTCAILFNPHHSYVG